MYANKQTAVIIRGNPKFVASNPAAEKFYAKLQKYMEQQGYAVSQDAGEPYTTPPPANVWLGHSRGVDRFRFAPEGTQTIGVGAPDGINHPDDLAMKPGDVPTAAHYKLTPAMLKELAARLQKQADDLHARFQPDYTPEQMESLGVYDALYRGHGPRLASLGEWKPEWISEHDPKGWAQWYKRYHAGRRIDGEDDRQIKRWLSFKARHGGPFAKNPTPRRGWALRNWGVDPANLVTKDLRNGVVDMLDDYKLKAMQKHIAEQQKQANDPAVTVLLPLAGLLGGGAVGAYKAPKGKKLKQGLIGAGIGGGIGLGGAVLHNILSPPEKGRSGSSILLPKTPADDTTIPLSQSKQPIKFDRPGDAGSRTLASQIERWYENAGGLDKAIEDAQKAQQNRNPAVLNENTWLKWKPEDVKGVSTPIKVVDFIHGRGMSPLTGGYFDPATKSITVTSGTPSATGKNGVIEHELSHSAFLNAQNGQPRQLLSTSDPRIGPIRRLVGRFAFNVSKDKNWQTGELAKKIPVTSGDVANMGSINAVRDYNSYLLDPAEVDVRLAEIKRIYAQQTGKVVKTPRQAADAISWFRDHMYGDPSKKLEEYLRKHKSLPTIDEYDLKKFESLPEKQKQQLLERMPELVQSMSGSRSKQAELLPEVQLQEHQQRIADRITGGDNRLLVYHGLGSGKSLSALAAAEAAKKVYGDDYGIVVPAALKGNFDKEVKKFTTDSDPEIMSYTGLGMGKQFAKPPQTLVMDEAHRLRNPTGAAAQAASRQARSARNLLLLTGSPITNSPTDLANLMSLLNNQKMSPEEFEKKFVGHRKVFPGIINWFRGVKPGEEPVVKNEKLLRSMLQGKVDYQPSKTPEGVNVDEKVVPVPLSPAQQKIQQAIRTKIPPGFLWKLDREFPLSRDELAKLNSFLTGLRQVSISTRPFRADKDPEKAFEQSAKLQQAFKDLQDTLTSDERKKAIIYSNHIDAGLAPYAAALAKNNIPHAMFHGGISARERQKAVNEYNEGKLRALLIGPAGAEGLSTRGTSLIQLLDPHWHESRSQQAKGRGLRFDSHRDLPEELKNVAVRRYISSSEDPSWVGKLMGYQRERTGDEILEHLAQEKEMLNDKFREILKQEGAAKTAQHEFKANGTGAAQWFREKNALTMPQMSMPQMSWPESIKLPWTDAENEKTTKSRGKKQPPQKVKRRKPKPVISDNALAGAVGAGAAALPLISLHQDAYGTYPVLRDRVRSAPLYFADDLAHSGLIRHGDAATYFGQPQGWFRQYKPNLSKLTQGGEWTSGSGTFHGMLLRPHNGSVQLLEGGDSFPAEDLLDDKGNIVSPFHEFMRTRNKEDAARGLWSPKNVDLYSQGENSPRFNPKLQDLQHNTSTSFFNRHFGALTKAMDSKQQGDAKDMPFFQRYSHYLKHLTRQGKLLEEYKRRNLHLTDNMDTWDDLANRTSYPMLVTRTPQIERLLDSKNPDVATQTRANIDKAFVDYKYRPYNLGGAIAAGTRRVLFPKITPTEQSTILNPESVPSLAPPRCTQDYCVQPLARVYEHHGVPMGAAANVVLPADIAANAGSIPVGMVVPHPHRQVNDKPWTLEALKKYKLAPTAESLAAFQADPSARLRVDMANPENAEGLKKYREDYRNTILYDWMPRSRNRRIATGLLAAAALGAAGYGGTKLVQSMIKARQKRLAQEAAKEEAKKKRTATRRLKAAASMLEVSTAAAAQYFASKTQKQA